MALTVTTESPLTPEARALLRESQRALEAVYPPEEIFSFDANELARDDIEFLVARAADGMAMGCVALVGRGGYGEVKRLFVRPEARGRGTASALMAELERIAAARGLALIRLETGGRLDSAVTLYARLGYGERGPFGDYAAHPASLFMEKRLA